MPLPRGVPWLAVLAVVFWGISFVATKYALGSLTPFGLVASRLLLAGTVLVLVARVRGVPFLPAEMRGRVVLLGLVLAVHLSIQAYGLVHTSSIHTGWIIGFTPVTTALGAQLFLGRPLARAGWLGTLVATTGVLLVTLEDPRELANARLGDLLQLVSCLTWAAYALGGVRAVTLNGSLRVAGPSILLAGLLLAPVATVGGWTSASPTLGALGAVVFLGVFCNAAAMGLWYRSQELYGVNRTGATLYLEPFVTLVAAMLLLDEELGWLAGVGGVVMLGGVWLVGRGSRGEQRT